jgi:hypothetical protein
VRAGVAVTEGGAALVNGFCVRGVVLVRYSVRETRTIPRFERVDYLTFGAKSAAEPGFQVLPDQHTDFPFSVWVDWSVIALLVGAGLSLLGWRWWRRRS